MFWGVVGVTLVLSLTPSGCCPALQRGSSHGVLCANPGYMMPVLCPMPCPNGTLVWGMRKFGVCLCPAGDVTSFLLPHFRVVPHTLSQHSSTRSSLVPLVFTLEPAPQSSELTVQTGGITLLAIALPSTALSPFCSPDSGLPATLQIHGLSTKSLCLCVW